MKKIKNTEGKFIKVSKSMYQAFKDSCKAGIMAIVLPDISGNYHAVLSADNF